MATRLFLFGAVSLFFGAQLRAVDTFVLNDKVSRIVNERVKEQPTVDIYSAGMYDSFDPLEARVTDSPVYRRVKPPRWLAWSFLSIGAVLVLTSPIYRNG